MTRESVMSLSAVQLRVEIAKALGYTNVHEGYNDTLWGDREPGCPYSTEIPDWPNSIEAAYALEERIPIEERDVYINNLWHIVFFKTDADLSKPGYYVIHATAEQRSRAWLIWHEERKEK